MWINTVCSVDKISIYYLLCLNPDANTRITLGLWKTRAKLWMRRVSLWKTLRYDPFGSNHPKKLEAARVRARNSFLRVPLMI